MSSAKRPIKTPGPDHPITIERTPNRVIISVAGRLIASTQSALMLREAHYPAVHYIPRKDVDMTFLDRTDHATYCPYKGDCAYFSIPIGGARSTNAAWTNQRPYSSVAAIKDHLAFTPTALTRSRNKGIRTFYARAPRARWKEQVFNDRVGWPFKSPECALRPTGTWAACWPGGRDVAAAPSEGN